MSTERPTKGLLVFQCDVCYDTREFSKANGDQVNSFQSCWGTLHEEGWALFQSQHLCEDCAQIAKTERERG